MRAISLVGLLLLGLSPIYAQPLWMAPRKTTTEWLTILTSPQSHSPSFQLQFVGHGATNVHPLFGDPPEKLEQPPFRGFFVQWTAYRGAVSHGKWRLSYSWERAQYYEGDEGAVHLYLEVNQKRLRTDTSYPVSAILNRSLISRWAIDYTQSYQMPALIAVVSVGLQGALVQSAQQGTLVGTKNGDQFRGFLTLETTRGIPASERDGFHFGIDTQLVVHTPSGWAFGLGVENLWGKTALRSVQYIEALVSVNEFELDSEGFLRSVPFLEGRVRNTRFTRKARPILHLGVAYQPTESLHVALLTERTDRWRWAVGITERSGWQIILWHNPSALQVGYWSPRGHFALGLDQARPHKARFLTLELGFQWH